jgi:hypothetical protein
MIEDCELLNYFFSKSGARLAEAQMMWNSIATTVEALGDDESERLVTYLRHLWVIQHPDNQDHDV